MHENGSDEKRMRLCLWSGPRNVSTALMYAFAQRSDTRVVDEPLYAHYLRVSGADHPGRETVLAGQDTDGNRVVRDVILGPCDRPVLFAKNMAHHLVDLDLSFLDQTINVILTRDPREMLPSLVHQIPEPTLRDTGLDRQCDLLDYLTERGQDVPVLIAREVLADPERVLRGLSERIGLSFDPAMLHWEKGPNPADGVWAPFWYHNIHRSTGFKPYEPKNEPIPDRMLPLLATCQPLFEHLVRHAHGRPVAR